MEIDMMKVIILAIFLLLTSYTDLKRKEVDMVVCALFALMALGIRLADWYCGEVNLHQLLISVFPGGVLLIMSKVTDQSIGMGDGVVSIIIGILLGIEKTVEILMFGFLISAAISIVMLLSKRVGRKYEIPFVPILSLSSAMVIGGII